MQHIQKYLQQLLNKGPSYNFIDCVNRMCLLLIQLHNYFSYKKMDDGTYRSYPLKKAQTLVLSLSHVPLGLSNPVQLEPENRINQQDKILHEKEEDYGQFNSRFWVAWVIQVFQQSICGFAPFAIYIMIFFFFSISKIEQQFALGYSSWLTT